MLPPLAVALLVATAVSGNIIPLEKRLHESLVINKDGVCDFKAVDLNLARSKSKYHANAVNIERNVRNSKHTGKLARRARASTIAARPLEPQQSASYWTGHVGLGTPIKVFSVDFDTGSTDATFCGSSKCSNGGARRVWNHAKSSTARDTQSYFYNWYGDGSESYGPVYQDTVQISNALRVKHQSLNMAEHMAGTLASISADGLMGFAFPALSASLVTKSVSANLLKQNLTKTNTVGFRLSSTPGVSQIFWGGYNKNLIKGHVAWYDIGKDPIQTDLYTYLQIPKSYAYVNGKRIASTKGSYILDTGTTLIVAPPKAAKAFWAAVPNSKALTGDYEGYYSYPCASPPTVSFSFGGANKLHTVAAEDWNYGRIGSTSRCMGAVVGADAGVGDSWILGDAFLMSQYSIFSVSLMKIGLATPK